MTATTLLPCPGEVPGSDNYINWLKFSTGTGLPALKGGLALQFFTFVLYPEKHICKNHYSLA